MWSFNDTEGAIGVASKDFYISVEGARTERARPHHAALVPHQKRAFSQNIQPFGQTEPGKTSRFRASRSFNHNHFSLHHRAQAHRISLKFFVNFVAFCLIQSPHPALGQWQPVAVPIGVALWPAITIPIVFPYKSVILSPSGAPRHVL